jgi:hypothetical protein
MKQLILIFLNLAWAILYCSGQNTQNVTLNFRPATKGYIVSVPILYKFVTVDGEVYLAANLGDGITSSQYHYEGRVYSASELVGQTQFSNLKSSLYNFTATADLYYGNSSLGQIRLPTLALSSGTADPYNVFKALGLNSRDYKDKTGNLYLRNMTLSIGVCSDSSIESIIRQKTAKTSQTTSVSAGAASSSQNTAGKSTSYSSYSSNQSGQQSKTTANQSSANKSVSGTAQGESLYGSSTKSSTGSNQYTQQQKSSTQQSQQSLQAEQKRQQLLSEISRREQQNKQMEQSAYQAAGELSNMVASMIASKQASDQAARERAELERLKSEEERLQKKEEERIAEEARRAENERIALLAEYYDNVIPELKKTSQYADSSLKEIFYIYVARTNESTLYFSNPFPVRRLSDNTWPYVSDINNKFKSETKVSDFKMVGYYNSYDIAITKARDLVQDAADSGYDIKEFSFKYKDYKAIPETSNKPAQSKKSSGSDFWNK